MDTERQRLLPGGHDRQDGRAMNESDVEQENCKDTGAGVGKFQWIADGVEHVRESWRVYQIVLIYLAYAMCYYGQTSANLELMRDLTCARHYEQHPELMDPADSEPCSADSIEASSAHFMLIADLLKGGSSAISVAFLGKKFSTWGRKPLLLLSLTPYLVMSLLSVAIPRGYPYGSLAADALISPTNCIYVYIVVCIITGLLGGDNLSSCTLRILIVDNSSSADRTKNLLALTVANLSGLTLGPLFTAAMAYLLPVSVTGIDGVLHIIGKHIYQLGRGNQSALSGGVNASLLSVFTYSVSEADRPPLTPPVPLPDFRAGHGNVTPFLVCIIGLASTILYAAFFVPETASLVPTDDDDSFEEDGEQGNTTSSASSVSPLRALIPVRRRDGTLDWRITFLFVALFLYYAGSYTINPYILFFGHALHWGPTKIDYLLSAWGATRLINIFTWVPFLVIFFEKTVKRPTRLRHLEVEEIHHLSKKKYGQETPSGDSAFAASSSLEYDDQEEEQDVHLLQGAIALWRARVDRTIVRLSWGFDIVGWFIVALGAMFKNTFILLTGGAITSFASGALPAFQSFGVTVTSDVLSGAEKRMDDDNGPPSKIPSHEHSGEIFFSLLSVLEAISQTLMPITTNLIYTATLSTFPAASFIVATLYYSLAFLALYAIVIHKSS
ncbi:hypothetical protein CBS101457_004644 [Exobasidium rhododendri]|nr:hypothetical protein CBS101457_004644 [Exobasidium rhododendri]